VSELKGNAVERYLTRGEPAVTLLLVHGSDPGLVTERCQTAATKFLAGEDASLALVKMSGSDLTEPGLLIDELCAISMFSARRVVWLRDFGQKSLVDALTVILDTAPKDALLIIEAGELRKTNAIRKFAEREGRAAVIACYPDNARDLASLVDSTLSEFNLTIEPEAKRALVDRLGSNRMTSRNELEKVCFFALDKRQIELHDVLSLVGDNAATQIDDLIDAVGQGQVRQAEVLLRRLLKDGQSPSYLAAAAHRHFQRLEVFAHQLKIGYGTDSIVAGARPPIFFNRKAAVQKQIQLWSVNQARAAQELLQTTILSQRRNASLDRTLLGNCFLRLARSKSSTNGRRSA
jgi:DNA polymerase-3 subunit delta